MSEAKPICTWSPCVTRTLKVPIYRRTPRLFQVGHNRDIFDCTVPCAYIVKIFAVMALTPQHTYQIVTRYPERMAAFLNHPETPMNVLRASVELQTPATRMQNQCGLDGWWPLRNVAIHEQAQNGGTQ